MKAGTLNLIILSIAVFLSTNLYAQYAGHDWGVALSYNYTTTSKVFPFPNSIDPVLRDQNYILENIFSYSVELRYRLSEPLIIGLGTEYSEKTKKNSVVLGGPSGSIIAEAEEGFSFIPVELSLYYRLPFSTDNFKFHMGGGLGVYFGNHLRKIKDAEFETVKQEITYGIHVSVGMDYLVTDYLSVRGEMRFRDPQFRVTSKYDKPDVEILGRTYILPQNSFDTKINVDGITFTVGAALHIF
jgi:hypothetical protein